VTDVTSVMCADGCAGCSAECAACSSSGCADCGGCSAVRMATAVRTASAALAIEHLHLLSEEEAELAFNPNQPRDAKGRWIKGGGSAPSINTGPSPRDYGNFTPTSDQRWAQQQRALGPRRKPRLDSSGDLKPEDVVPTGDGGWATVVPGKNTARTAGYAQVVRDGEPYSNAESISSIKSRIDAYAAEKAWRDAGGSKEQFDGRAGRPASEPEGSPTPGTAKTKRAVKPRTAKATPAPAPAAVDENEPSPDMGSEYIPQHLADVRDYLDGKKKAPLPLSYLYGGVSKDSWRKFFSPGQRARVLRESREIRDGMSDDARDKGMLDRAVGWLEEIAEEEKPGYVPSASRKVQDHLATGEQKGAPLPLATLYGQVEPQSWRDHFTPKQRAKALRNAKRELKRIQKGPHYKGRYSDEGLLDRTIQLLEGIESEQRTAAAPPPSNL
jgi:hypothetical protein